MCKLEIKLKQHTPLIHFQHDQEGATLRASEVKPKLDRFILTKLGENEQNRDVVRTKCNDDYQKAIAKIREKFPNQTDLDNYNYGILFANEKGWIRAKGALDYKMKIFMDKESEEEPCVFNTNEPDFSKKKKYSKTYEKEIVKLQSYPLFFSNMDKDYEDKKEYRRFTQAFNLKIKISFFDDTFSQIIKNKETLNQFFFTHNFGTRQSKGFGSFYIDENDEMYLPPVNKYSFKINMLKHDNWKDFYYQLFDELSLFYNTLRSGINLKDSFGNTEFYFKSLAFMYSKDILNSKWDKRRIKEFFFKNSFDYKTKNKKGKEICIHVKGLDEQVEDYNLENNSFPLNYSNGNGVDIRDLLGLSTAENWLYYKNATINKSQTKFVAGRYIKIEENQQTISRMRSPILLKPINTQNDDDEYFTIYLLFQDKEVGVPEFKDMRKICIEKKGNNRSLLLDIPSLFNSKEFLDYVLLVLDIDLTSHIDGQFHKHPYFDILNNIYVQLKNNVKQ